MSETYGELIGRLCQLRDQLNSTPAGRAALVDVIVTMEYAIRDGVTYGQFSTGEAASAQGTSNEGGKRHEKKISDDHRRG